MQTLQVVQNSFKLMGINPKLQPFNHITLRILILGFLGICLQWTFLIYGADSSQGRIKTIYVVTGCTGAFVSYASTILITTELFSFIDKFNELTNESTYYNFNHLKTSD